MSRQPMGVDDPAMSVPTPRNLRRSGFIWITAGAIAIALLTFVVSRFSRPRVNPDSLWAEAESAFLAGRWDLAKQRLAKLETLRPRTGLDWMLQAQIAIAGRQPDLAFAALSHISDDHPIAAQAHLLAGRLWRQEHCIRKAEIELRRALALNPGLIEAHKELVYILGIQSRRREVDAEFHALARLAPLSHHDLFTWRSHTSRAGTRISWRILTPSSRPTQKTD